MMNDFSQKLIKLRKEKGLTQEDLAKRLNISRQAVSKWENGNSLPSVDLFDSIAKEFDVTLDMLLNQESVCQISIKNNEKVEKVRKVNKTIVVLLIISMCLASFSIIFAIIKNVRLNKKIDEDLYVGIFIDLDSNINRNDEEVTYQSLTEEKKPMLLIEVDASEKSRNTTMHSYGFSGGNIRGGYDYYEYTGSTLYYNKNRITKFTFYEVIKKDDKLYLKFSTEYSTNGLKTEPGGHIISKANSIKEWVNIYFAFGFKQIEELDQLEIKQYNSQNAIVKSELVDNTVSKYFLEENISYIEIKYTYKDNFGKKTTISERKYTKEVFENSKIFRMITNADGIVDEISSVLKIEFGIST